MSQQFPSKIYVHKKLKSMCTQTFLHGFIAALSITDKNRSTPHFHQLMNGYTKCVFYIDLMPFISKKEMMCWKTPQHRWTLKTFAKWKGANHKRPYTVWFLFYELFRIGKSIEGQSRLVFSRYMEGGKMKVLTKVKLESSQQQL